MKTLLLMRHAKSSWKDKKLDDHERPLNKRGKKDAPHMGALIKEKELIPQVIVSSSAERARETALAVAESSGFAGDITYLDRLYMAEADEILTVLNVLPDEIDRAMVVGHNPGLEYLFQMLSGKIESLQTAVIAQISLPIESWSQVGKKTKSKDFELWRPKERPLDIEPAKKEKKPKKKK